MSTEPMKPWQKGVPLGRLKAVAEVFSAHDEGMIHGAFLRAKENLVADWIDGAELRETEDGSAFAVVRYQEGRRAVNGWGERPAGVPLPGACLVKRAACRSGEEEKLRGLIELLARGKPELWLEMWAEHRLRPWIVEALGLRQINAKVMAGSEIIGIYYRGPQPLKRPPRSEVLGLSRLQLQVPPIAAALEALQGLSFAQHYSGYNKRASWSALALRGFNAADPTFIIKPSEMSRKWKADNAPTLSWRCTDTELRGRLSALEPLIAAVPGEKERVRLMRLAPGGGELLRHADITDPDSGVAPGRLLRVHIPLLTNPDVLFTQWFLDGSQRVAHMPAGEAWYLDTRKPHTAVNNGPTERLHLVMDVFSSPELLALLV